MAENALRSTWSILCAERLLELERKAAMAAWLHGNDAPNANVLAEQGIASGAAGAVHTEAGNNDMANLQSGCTSHKHRLLARP